MKIKVCGMRNPDNILALASLKPDYMGFIFYLQSKRYTKEIPKQLIDKIPVTISKTGVFVDSDFDEIIQKVEENHLKSIQLHGNESVDLCSRLKDTGLEVIKAVGVDENFDFGSLENYTKAVDHFLFDTKTPLHGGSGISFDWSLLNKYPYQNSYFLSGGISLENLQEIKEIKDERLYAVDLNSRFETSPGMKDINKLEKAITLIRS